MGFKKLKKEPIITSIITEDKDLHIGAAVILFSPDGKILLGKRKGIAGTGMYGCPGGHVEPYEPFVDTVHREVMEETNLKISNVRFLICADNYYESKNKWYRTFFHTAETTDINPINVEPEKCEGWDWYSLDNLPTPLFELSDEIITMAKNYLALKQKWRKNK